MSSNLISEVCYLDRGSNTVKMRMENCNAFRNALGSSLQTVYFGIRFFVHFIRFYHLVLWLLSLPRLLSFLWLTYLYRGYRISVVALERDVSNSEIHVPSTLLLPFGGNGKLRIWSDLLWPKFHIVYPDDGGSMFLLNTAT